MRPNSSSSSPRIPGRPRANRRITSNQPSAHKGNGLFSRVRSMRDWFINKRFHTAAILFVILWVFLWYRAFEVQVLLGPIYKDLAQKQHSYTEVIDGVRGSILDRNGRVLARSIVCRSVHANPRVMQDIDDAARRLAPILKRNVSDLKNLFRKNKAFIWLARKVDDATASAIEKEHIPGIVLTREYERVYPYRHLAGQLLGFVGVDNKGLEGVELAYDELLQGSSSKNRVSRNAAEKVLAQQDAEDEHRGQDITLSIDVQIQFIAEDVLSDAVQASGAKWGGVLVSDVESGEILAWAQYPFFNPNNYRESNFSIYRNRLAGDSLEPGSTFKPFLMAAALEEKLVTPETTIYCEKGVWRTKYAPIRDDTHSFEDLTATEIISKSSNIGTAKIGLQLGAPKYHSYLNKLGFGQRTGIGIHESRGILRNPRDWSELDLMSTSFGQSVSVTGIQMLQAYTILADGGEFRPLRLVLDHEGVNSSTSAGQRIFSKNTTQTVLKMMEETVDGDGTGKRARIPGLRVAGKTGTAQKANTDGKGYSSKRLASFGGIVPADAPRYAIYVMLDEPTTTGYGGAIAAPVFQKVATRALAYSGYLPDVTFALAEQEQERKLTPAQKAQQEKDAIYLANLAKYRAEKAKKAREAAIKTLSSSTDGPVMPDLYGLSLRRTIEVCAAKGLIPAIEGSGAFVLKQSPPAGSPLDEESTCTVWLTDTPPPSESESTTIQE